MGTLRIAAALVGWSISGAARADGVARWRPLIEEASAKFGVAADRIERVMRAESAGRTTLAGLPIRSRAGAMGLMQLMPKTWAAIRQQLGLGANPDDPRDNILAGTAFLAQMQARFGYPGMFAAYNMGPTGYQRYLAGRAPLPPETVAYLGKLTGSTASSVTAETPPTQLLFALRRDLGGEADNGPERPSKASLFAIRRGEP